MKDFVCFLLLSFFLFFPSLSKKMHFRDFPQINHHNEQIKGSWDIIYSSEDSKPTKWNMKYEWLESPNDFACGVNFHFPKINEYVKNFYENKLIPSDLNFYMCNFNNWNKQWSFGTLDINEPSALMCPENNFIIGFQWYWTQEEVIASDFNSPEVFRLKIICSPFLNFIGFDERENYDPVVMFKDSLICGYQIGTTKIKDRNQDSISTSTFANGLKVKMCKSPEINEFWKTIEDGIYGRWLTPKDWSNRYLDYYGCGINLILLKPEYDEILYDNARIQGMDMIICNKYNWNYQQTIKIKSSNYAYQPQYFQTILQNCPDQEFITGLQVRYDFPDENKFASGIVEIRIKCGDVFDIEEEYWITLETGIEKGIWRERKYLLGGICGIIFKWNKESGRGDSSEFDETGPNGMKIKVCPQLFKKKNWKKVFDLSKTVQKKISWDDNYFGCGLVISTQRLNSPYMFLNPDFFMKISVVACKIDNWKDQIIREEVKYNEYKKTMCPENEFIYGIQRYMKKSKIVQVDQEMMDDFFRLRIICGPSMNSFDVFAGNPNLYSMFFIEKADDEVIFFGNGLVVGYRYGFSNLTFALKTYQNKIENVISSLSFELRPIFTDEVFYSRFAKNSWKSLSKVESDSGQWEKIIEWSAYINTYSNKYYFTFENNIFLSGMSFLVGDINYIYIPMNFTIGQSNDNFNFTCDHNKFISGIQLKRARFDKTNVFIGYRILCEYFDGDSTFSDWSTLFEANVKGGYWDDRQFFIYGGKKAFLCGVAPKKSVIFYEQKKYEVITDLDIKMCSFSYGYTAIEEIVQLEGSSEGNWMKFMESNVKLEGKPASNFMEYKDWIYTYYACGVRISRSDSSSIEGMEFKFCSRLNYAVDYFWQRLDSEFDGPWEEQINCPNEKFIAGLQLKFKNLDYDEDQGSDKSEEEIEPQNKGEIVGFRILCRKNEKKSKGFLDESWMNFKADSIGIWGKRYYSGLYVFFCSVGGKKFQGKLNGIQMKICNEIV